MIIYCNYTTICRKIQVCIFFFDRKINFLRCHLCNKMSFSWIPEFFRKERTGVFHLSISITEHHFHVEPANFSEKKKPDIPLNCDISGFSHSFGVRIFNWWRRFTSFQICVLLKFANSGMAIFRTFFSFLIPIMLCTCDIFSRIPEFFLR